MKVLLIGGTGTISLGVARELLRMGADLTLFHRGTSGLPGARHIAGDRYSSGEFLEKVRGLSFDCVIDMICYHAREAQDLVTAFSGNAKQVVFCSTVNTYRAPAPVYPVAENCPIGADPRFTYAYEKVLCEKVLQDAAEKGAFALTIVRPGATVRDDALPISFLGDGAGLMRRMLEGKPILVLGDGSSLWASAHRDDVGKAIAHAAGDPRTYGKGYTLASEAAMTWEQYYETAAEAFGAPRPEFVRIPWELLVDAFPEECSWAGLNFRFNNIYSCEEAKKDLGFVQTLFWKDIMERSATIHAARGDLAQAQEHPAYGRTVSAWKDAAARFLTQMRS